MSLILWCDLLVLMLRLIVSSSIPLFDSTLLSYFLVWLFVFLSYVICVLFFFFKQKTAYEMRISDWSSDVCSSDLSLLLLLLLQAPSPQPRVPALLQQQHVASAVELGTGRELCDQERAAVVRAQRGHGADREARREAAAESGSDDRVADLDVGRPRDVGQFELVAAALAVGHQAYAVAPDPSRHGVVGIGDQQAGCRGWRGLDDQPDPAAGVAHALAHATAPAGACAAGRGPGRERG